MNIEKHVDRYLARDKANSRSEGSKKDRIRHLSRFKLFLYQNSISDLKEVDHTLINDFYYDCCDIYDISYENIYTTHLSIRLFFESLIQEGFLQFNPTLLVVVKKKQWIPTKILVTNDEFDHIWNFLNNDNKSLPYLVLLTYITLLRDTGCRRTSGLGINWSDIDFKKNKIKIIASKSNAKGYVTMTERLSALLVKLKKLTKGTDIQPVFIGQNHKRLAPSSLNHHFNKFIDESGVNISRNVKLGNPNPNFPSKLITKEDLKITPHTLKHSFISYSFKNGNDVEEIKQTTLNSSSQVVYLYNRTSYEDHKHMVDIVNNMFSEALVS